MAMAGRCVSVGRHLEAALADDWNEEYKAYTRIKDKDREESVHFTYCDIRVKDFMAKIRRSPYANVPPSVSKQIEEFIMGGLMKSYYSGLKEGQQHNTDNANIWHVFDMLIKHVNLQHEQLQELRRRYELPDPNACEDDAFSTTADF
tara:strand:+ start:1976 stop:2416 length:441 start_codon:yes stop_codon:yes gene_type:complete